MIISRFLFLKESVTAQALFIVPGPFTTPPEHIIRLSEPLPPLPGWLAVPSQLQLPASVADTFYDRPRSRENLADIFCPPWPPRVISKRPAPHDCTSGFRLPLPPRVEKTSSCGNL